MRAKTGSERTPVLACAVHASNSLDRTALMANRLRPQPHGFEGLGLRRICLGADRLRPVEGPHGDESLVDGYATALPAPHNVSDCDHVLARIDDVLDFEAVVRPELTRVREQR